jgi:signal transduction histidine kinase
LQLLRMRIEVRDGCDPAATLCTLEQLLDPCFQNSFERTDVQLFLAEINERLGRYEQALAHHRQWTEAKARAASIATRERVKRWHQTVLATRAEAVEFITHDLRNPLAAAIGRLQALPVEPLPQSARAPIDEVVADLRCALGTADRYLSILRAQYMPRSELRPLDLGGLADDVCETQASQAATAVGLVRDIAVGSLVQGDRALLMRALTALLANAFAQAPLGSDVHVRVACTDAERNVVLSVCDRGHGSPLPLRGMLDSLPLRGPPHERLESEGTQVDSGLGLALVARVARLHRARVAIDREPGRGTTVSLHFRGRAVSAPGAGRGTP